MKTWMSERLLIRPVTLKDAPDMYDYAKNPSVGPLAGWHPHVSVDETKAVIRQMLKPSVHSSGVYAVCLHDNKLIGTIDIHNIQPGFKGEMGLVLHPQYHGQGIMTEAGKIILMHGFEDLALKRIEYRHFKNNHASKRLREKLMFRYEGLLRSGHQMPDKTVVDTLLSAMTDVDYFIQLSTFFAHVKATTKTL
jgi:RimJ/RimL family protein N-acetyltransferase